VAQKSYFLENKRLESKKKSQKDHQNSVKTLHLSKKFTSKLTRAKENF